MQGKATAMRDHPAQHRYPEKGADNRPSPRSVQNKETAPVRHPENRQNQRAQTPGEKKHDDHASCPDKSIARLIPETAYYTP
jgi:hypothetical protein